MDLADFQRKLQTIRNDPHGSMSWILDQRLLAVERWLSTFLGYWNAWSWGVELAHPAAIFGALHFRKYPGSGIRFGPHCTFRSAFRSNLVGINRPCAFSTCAREARIQVGERCGFSGTVIGARVSVILGQGVICGANSLITDFDWHCLDPDDRGNFEKIKFAPVVIEDRVWLGANTTVLKGVKIGENSVIGANSTITASIPRNVIAAGNPAVVLRQINR
jgi:acetyltransferase-like isoleucine patch superfamily enzyme